MAKPKIVYLMYTQSEIFPHGEMMGVYSKTSYRLAFNRMVDIAERHRIKVEAGDGRIAVQVVTEKQQWWVERHEVL